MIYYDSSAQRAHVMIGEETRELPARYIDGDPKKYLVSGFACAFETGLKIWSGNVTFREVTPGTFSYYDLECSEFVPPGRGSPPHVVGFSDGIAKTDQGNAQGSVQGSDYFRRWPSFISAVPKQKRKPVKKKAIVRKRKRKAEKSVKKKARKSKKKRR